MSYEFWYELSEGETRWHREGKETVTRVPGGWNLDKYEEIILPDGVTFLGLKTSIFIPYNEEFKREAKNDRN